MPSQFWELRCIALSEFFCCFACSPAGKPADAQECAALAGRMRLACEVAKYPAFGAPVERGKDEARDRLADYER